MNGGTHNEKGLAATITCDKKTSLVILTGSEDSESHTLISETTIYYKPIKNH